MPDWSAMATSIVPNLQNIKATGDCLSVSFLPLVSNYLRLDCKLRISTHAVYNLIVF